MNIATNAARLLSHFSPEERSIPDNATFPGRNGAVMVAMNSALQDLFGKGKPWVRHDERGVVVNQPTTVSINVTAGSDTASISGWLPWFSGCTIIIDGAAVDNQIRNNASPVKLKFPYSGSTGTKSATIYHDSVEIDSAVLEVHEPVQFDGRQLAPIPNPYSILGTRPDEDFGSNRYADVVPTSRASVSATANVPLAFCVETWSLNDATPPRIRMRLSPAAASQGFLQFPVMLAPPVIAAITSTEELPIPFGFVESIFFPIARKHLRACPFWRGMVGDEEVESAYRNALALLAEGNPKKSSGIRFTTKF